MVPIGALRPGQDAVVEGRVIGADVVMGKRRSLLVRINDGTGGLSLRFYHFSNAQESLKRGTEVRCYGEARGASGLESTKPEYRAITGDGHLPVDTTLTPIYPTTEGPDPAASAPAQPAKPRPARPAQLA